MASRMPSAWLPSKDAGDIGRRSVSLYYLVVLVLSLPFWLLGSTAWDLRELTQAPVPVSALMFVCPSAATLLILARRDRVDLRAWLRSILRWPRAQTPVWVLVSFGGVPLAYVGAWVVQRAFDPNLPAVSISWSKVPLLVAVYAVAALAEEVGWSAYATDPLLARHSALTTSLYIGVAWAGWHLVPYTQTSNTLGWIVGQCVFTVALRTVIVLVYANTGLAMVAAATVHAGSNLAWSLFPKAGSAYNPWLVSVFVVVLALVLYPRSIVSVGR